VHEYASGLTSSTKTELFCSCKRKKFIGQNKVKICKLLSQNFKFLCQKFGCLLIKQHTFAFSKETFQKTSSSSYWNSNYYQTISCRYYWHMSCLTKRLQLKQKLNSSKIKLSGAIEKHRAAHCRLTMTIVAVSEQLRWLRVSKQCSSVLIFVGKGSHAWKILWTAGSAPVLHTASIDNVSSRRCSAGLDWKQSVQSANGRSWLRDCLVE